MLSFHYRFRHWPLYLFSFSIFFWSIFDGIISYITPLVLVENGLSKTVMGIIIASSSVAGAGFDFLLAKFLKNTHFRRLYLLMFLICFIYPLLLWQAKTIWLYLIVMALWGLYYDLLNFGLFDFISRKTEKDEFSSSFGVVSVFKSLGYLLGPVFAGLLIGKMISWQPFIFSWVCLFVAFIFFLVLIVFLSKNKSTIIEQTVNKKINFLKELHLWSKVGKTIFPVLIFTLLLNIIDAFFWTIGPLFAENLAGLHPLGGLLVTFYMFPSLILGWLVGNITDKFGKKRTAFFSFIIGSIFLILLTLIKNPLIVLVLVFCFSCFASLSWPAIKATFSDYISETPTLEKEIEGLADFFANIGYVIGPITAGVLADLVGNQNAFGVLGITGIVTVLVLIKITPKEIRI